MKMRRGKREELKKFLEEITCSDCAKTTTECPNCLTRVEGYDYGHTLFEIGGKND